MKELFDIYVNNSLKDEQKIINSCKIPEKKGKKEFTFEYFHPSKKQKVCLQKRNLLIYLLVYSVHERRRTSNVLHNQYFINFLFTMRVRKSLLLWVKSSVRTWVWMSRIGILFWVSIRNYDDWIQKCSQKILFFSGIGQIYFICLSFAFF